MDSPKVRKWALVGIVVSMLALGFDLTIVNVALPMMGADLGAGVLSMFVVTGLLFVVPQYLHTRLTPLMIGLIVVGKKAPKLMERFGPRPLITLGMLLISVATLLGSRTDAIDGYGYTALWLTLTGFSFGVAVLGSLLNKKFTDQLDTDGLPAG